MEFQFHGANCVTITTKKARLTIDDNLVELGATSIAKPADIAIFTHEHGAPKAAPKLLIDGPGEYEVSNVVIHGVKVRAHMDEAAQQTATLYSIACDDTSIVVVGNIHPDLSDKVAEALGLVDVLFLPVGGNGYTLDAVGALQIIKKLEPKLVIPTHYADKTLNFPVPQADLETALRELAMEPKERVPKLRLKTGDLTDSTQLIVLEKS